MMSETFYPPFNPTNEVGIEIEKFHDCKMDSDALFHISAASPFAVATILKCGTKSCSDVPERTTSIVLCLIMAVQLCVRQKQCLLGHSTHDQDDALLGLQW